MMKWVDPTSTKIDTILDTRNSSLLIREKPRGLLWTFFHRPAASNTLGAVGTLKMPVGLSLNDQTTQPSSCATIKGSDTSAYAPMRSQWSTGSWTSSCSIWWEKSLAGKAEEVASTKESGPEIYIEIAIKKLKVIKLKWRHHIITMYV